MKVLFTTLVMLYLVVDVGDPNLPGAVSFDPDDCVEVVQAQRAPHAPPPQLTVTPEPIFRLARPHGTTQGIVRPKEADSIMALSAQGMR